MSVDRPKYWPAIDMVKAIVLICVLTEHLIHLPSKDSIIRFTIGLFHMPVFIGISGFLFGCRRLDGKISQMLPHIFKRLLVPWLIATCVYYFIHLTNDGFSVVALLKLLLYPYYHLWYIPAIIGYMLLTWGLWQIFPRKRQPFIALLSIALLVSILSQWECLRNVTSSPLYARLYYMIDNEFKFDNYVFFVLGVWLRYLYDNGKLEMLAFKGRALMLAIVFAVSFIPFFGPYDNIWKICFYLFNFIALPIIIQYCTTSWEHQVKFLVFIGKYSLPIYLYHVLAIQLSILLFKSGPVYYLFSYLFFALLCLMVFYLKKISIINRYIFGSTSTTLLKGA